MKILTFGNPSMIDNSLDLGLCGICPKCKCVFQLEKGDEKGIKTFKKNKYPRIYNSNRLISCPNSSCKTKKPEAVVTQIQLNFPQFRDVLTDGV